MTDEPVQPWTLVKVTAGEWPPAPPPDATWPLGVGTGWVYYGTGHTQVVKLIILADGFSGDPKTSDVDNSGTAWKVMAKKASSVSSRRCGSAAMTQSSWVTTTGRPRSWSTLTSLSLASSKR